MPVSVPTWTGSDVAGSHGQEASKRGCRGVSSKKEIIFNSPSMAFYLSLPLPPPPTISIQGIKIHNQKLKDHNCSCMDKAKQNLTETHRIFLLKNDRFFLLQLFCFILVLSLGFWEKTSQRRNKALKVFKYPFCLFTSVPLTINYSSSFPKINSQ